MDLQFSNIVFTEGKSLVLDKVKHRFVLPAEVKNLKKVAFAAENPLFLLGAVIYIYTEKIDGLILHVNRLNDKLKENLLDRGYSLCIIDSSNDIKCILSKQEVSIVPGRISVLTSGTTGDPKLISHTWNTIFTQAKNRSCQNLNWLVPYTPGSYAWYQLITMWMFVPNQDITLPTNTDPEAMWDAAVLSGVNAISSTPTLWRYLLYKRSGDQLKKLSFKQITLGGEPVQQPLLNDLHSLYPETKITQIYASTEGGASIIVNDGKEGFPIEWLNSEDSKNRPSLKVKNRILLVKSPYQSTDFEGWYCTNDRVEVREDRVVIVGRAEDGFLNIGGNKANARNIEEQLLNHEDIYWCRVFAKKAPIVGELVAAEVVANGSTAGKSDSELEKVFTEYCIDIGMNDWMIPRLWRFVEDIPLNANLKSELKK